MAVMAAVRETRLGGPPCATPSGLSPTLARARRRLRDGYGVELVLDLAPPTPAPMAAARLVDAFLVELESLPPAVLGVVASPLVRRITLGTRLAGAGCVLGTYVPHSNEASFSLDLWGGRIGPILGITAACHTLVHELYGHGLTASSGMPIRRVWLPYLAATHLPDPLTSPYLHEWVAAMLGPGGGPAAVSALFAARLRRADPALAASDRVTAQTLTAFESAIAGTPRYAPRLRPGLTLGLFASDVVGRMLNQHPGGGGPLLGPLDPRAAAAFTDAVRRYRAAALIGDGPEGEERAWSLLPLESPLPRAAVDRLVDRRLAAAGSSYRATDVRRALSGLDALPSAYAAATPIEAFPEHLTVEVAVPALHRHFPQTLALCARILPGALRELTARTGPGDSGPVALRWRGRRAPVPAPGRGG
ncbi:MAG TPA: hypothetical protein VMW49_06245 [Candidatus Dormibacteraeota bacterium]|nr:hypothetical protein [Candidatus Dormibacteraeota bacterium]